MSRSTSDNSIHQKRPRGKVLTTGHSICSSLPLQAGQGGHGPRDPLCAPLWLQWWFRATKGYWQRQKCARSLQTLMLCKPMSDGNTLSTSSRIENEFFISIVNVRYYTAQQSGSSWPSFTTQGVNEQVLTNLLNSQLNGAHIRHCNRSRRTDRDWLDPERARDRRYSCSKSLFWSNSIRIGCDCEVDVPVRYPYYAIRAGRVQELLRWVSAERQHTKRAVEHTKMYSPFDEEV